MKRTREPIKAKPLWVRGPGTRRSVSWPEIERAILLRIARKEYLPGQRIPTCEELAAEFSANKNTVSKAYRSLAQRGYLLTRAGFGTFVSKRPVRVSIDGALDAITGLLSLALQEAKLSGLQAPQFRKLVDDVVSQGFGRAGPRVGFIECNRHDATTLSRDLQLALSHPVEPLLIDEVAAAPARFLRDYDILAVNLTHLAAVEGALAKSPKSIKSPGSRDGAQVFGLHVPIDPESLTRVARLRAGTRLGIICDLQQSLVSLTGVIAGCNAALTVGGCLSRERAAVRRLFAASDVMLITPSAAERLRAEESQIPVITVAFRADERSVEQLGALIAQHVPETVSYALKTKTRSASRA